MTRLLMVVLGLGTILSFSGCGDSCESVRSEMEEIGREIQRNPSTAMDRAGELEELRGKLQEMGCLG